MFSIRSLSVLLLVVLLCSISGTMAGGKDVRILVLNSQDAEPYKKALAGFRDALRVQGINATLEIVSLRGDIAAAQTALESRTDQGVDIIFSLGALALQAARPTGLTAPMVVCLVMNAREFELLPHATGVVLEFPVLTEIEWLRRFMPGRDNIAVIYNPEENQQRIDIAMGVAGKLGVKLHTHLITMLRDLSAKLDEVGRDAEVIWGIPDHLVMTPQTAKAILLSSFRNRIPVVGLSTSWVKAGALYALDRDYADIGAQAAELAGKIIGGIGAKSIVPVAPRKTVYSINLRTARHMKLELAEELIKGAAEVIE